MRFQEIGRHHRRDSPRHGKADQHCGHHGEPEILEKLTRNTGHKTNRQEHRDNRHRRRQHGKADFVGGIDRCLIRGFAHAHMADDILDLDDGIIDKDTGHKAQGEQ